MRLFFIFQFFIGLFLGLVLFVTKDGLAALSFWLGSASDWAPSFLMATLVFFKKKNTQDSQLNRFYLGELLKLLSTLFCFIIPLVLCPQLRFSWFLFGFFLSRVTYLVALLRIKL